MSEGRLVTIFVNPLQFLEVDKPWAPDTDAPPTPENILAFLCTPGVESDVGSLVERYTQISTEKRRLFAAPAEARILEKLVWPLRHAKASYMIGNYLGTISLCGMVAEMVAILLFEISEFRLNNQVMTTSDQTALFGSTFEKLSQHRRVQILHAYGIIDAETKSAFDLIRTKRRRYLHLWSQDHDVLPDDTIAVFQAAVSVVVKAIGQDIREGMIYLNPALVKYLERSGVYEFEDDSNDATAA